jgi:glutamate/tyrosine decarboxylase-like PLP-dependent enzyme
MNHYSNYLPLLEKALESLDEWRSSFGITSDEAIKPNETVKLEHLFDQFIERLSDNYPFHHPSYAGQMLKPPHPAAWAAYSLAMTINPNNHALDGGPPTSEMEQEVMEKLAEMVGYHQPFLGHLTSGGTIANLEALWIAREIHPKKAIASSANAHYTHQRMCNVLNTKHISVPVDESGVPDMDFLKKYADKIGTMVVTMGTTGMGTVEPLHVLMPWAESHDIRIHLDAAYGGFYKLLAGEEGIEKAPWELTGRADSIVIDPHKHGLQPYGCGSVLFRDPGVGRFYSHDSPYTYFTSKDLHLGEITLECSRAGASAAALWLTLQLLPLNRQGLGDVLINCRRAALRFAAAIHESVDFNRFSEPDLDIVCYYPVPDKKNTSVVSALSQDVLKKQMSKSTKPLFLSVLKVPSDHFVRLHPGYKKDSEETVILRSVLMKPEHEQFVGELLKRLEQ